MCGEAMAWRVSVSLLPLVLGIQKRDRGWFAAPSRVVRKRSESETVAVLKNSGAMQTGVTIVVVQRRGALIVSFLLNGSVSYGE